MLPRFGVLSGTLVRTLRDAPIVLAFAPGYHDLQHTPSSGAWDYIRAAQFRVRLGCLFVMMPDAVTRPLMQIRPLRSRRGAAFDTAPVRLE